MSFAAQFERRPVGLENGGNTCYCNAVLQLLFAATQFCEWFLQRDAREVWNPRSRFKGELLTSWVELLRQVYSTGGSDVKARGNNFNETLSSRRLLSLLRSQHPQFAEYRQSDAHEFLRNFLDGLSGECNRVLKPAEPETLEDVAGEGPAVSSERFWNAACRIESSVVGDLFGGQLCTHISCGLCGGERHRFDGFLDLSLDLGGGPRCQTLEQIIANTFQRKAVSLTMLLSTLLSVPCLLLQCLSVNAFRPQERRELDCPFCRRRGQATVKSGLWRLPSQYIVLHLKRFRWEASQGGLRRVNDDVVLPPQRVLNMEQFCPLSDHPSTKNAVFVLEGVVAQSGTAESGHYVAATWLGSQCWFFSDDSAAPVRSLPDGKSVYLLLWRRLQTTESSVWRFSSYINSETTTLERKSATSSPAGVPPGSGSVTNTRSTAVCFNGLQNGLVSLADSDAEAVEGRVSLLPAPPQCAASSKASASTPTSGSNSVSSNSDFEASCSSLTEVAAASSSMPPRIPAGWKTTHRSPGEQFSSETAFSSSLTETTPEAPREEASLQLSREGGLCIGGNREEPSSVSPSPQSLSPPSVRREKHRLGCFPSRGSVVGFSFLGGARVKESSSGGSASSGSKEERLSSSSSREPRRRGSQTSGSRLLLGRMPQHKASDSVISRSVHEEELGSDQTSRNGEALVASSRGACCSSSFPIGQDSTPQTSAAALSALALEKKSFKETRPGLADSSSSSSSSWRTLQNLSSPLRIAARDAVSFASRSYAQRHPVPITPPYAKPVVLRAGSNGGLFNKDSVVANRGTCVAGVSEDAACRDSEASSAAASLERLRIECSTTNPVGLQASLQCKVKGGRV